MWPRPVRTAIALALVAAGAPGSLIRSAGACDCGAPFSVWPEWEAEVVRATGGLRPSMRAGSAMVTAIDFDPGQRAPSTWGCGGDDCACDTPPSVQVRLAPLALGREIRHLTIEPDDGGAPRFFSTWTVDPSTLVFRPGDVPRSRAAVVRLFAGDGLEQASFVADFCSALLDC